MAWGAIGYNGKTNIRFVNGKLKSPDYMKLINEEIMLHAQRIRGEKFIVQQDTAAVFIAKIVKNYFDTHDIVSPG